MAKIGAYTSDRGIGTGSEFLRPAVNPGEDIARGIVQFGSAVEKLGKVDKHNQEMDARKAEAQALRDDNVRLNADALELRTVLRDRALLDREALGDNTNAEGYTLNLQNFANEEVERRIRDRFPNRRDQDFVRLAYARVTEPLLDQAAIFEGNRRQAWRASVSADQLNSLATSLATNATPENLTRLYGEWDGFVTSSLGGGPAVQQRYFQLGRQKLQRAYLDAVAGRDPVAFLNQATTALQNQPTAANRTPAANPLVAETFTQADAHGVSRSEMLAIAWLEGRLNPNVGRNRRSSAEGPWQMTAEFARGIGVQNVNDVRESTAAAAGFLSRVQTRLRERGITVTPGALYMSWNMGEPLANAVMNADPGERIENVIRRLYAGSRGLAFAEQVLANNPTLYRAGMTVGQVRSSYETAMTNASRETRGFRPNEEIPSSDEQARATLASLTGIETDALSARDLGEVLTQARTAASQASRGNQHQIQGENFLTGVGRRADPYSQADRTDVAAAVLARGTATGLVVADTTDQLQANHLEARRVIDAAGFVPTPILHAYREAMNSAGGGQHRGKVLAYRTLASLQDSNPAAFDATQLPQDEANRIKEFRMMTESLGLTEQAAIERIEFRRSPAGRQAREATKEMFQGRQSELLQRNWNELRSAFDTNGWLPGRPGAPSDRVQAEAVAAYQDAYRYWREKDNNVDDARRLALQDMREIWGVSHVTGSQVLTMYPVERRLGPSRMINGSFDWVAQQARDHVATYIMSRADTRRCVGGTALPGSQWGAVENFRPNATPEEISASVTDFRLVPTSETASDVAAGRIPRYNLMYRAPDGNVLSAGMFRPNYEGARERAEADFIARPPVPRRQPPVPGPLDQPGEVRPGRRTRWGQFIPE